MTRRAAGLLLLVLLAGCGRAVTTPRRTSVALNLKMAQVADDRVYSVGSVQFRSLDAAGTTLSQETVPIDRATGVIDVVLDAIPAGLSRRVLVEPLGSGILPNGGRTESGVALQGLSDAFDLEAGGSVTLEVTLLPYIPDNLHFEFLDLGTVLAWDVMQTAQSHTIRVLEIPAGGSALTGRLVDVPGRTGRVLVGALLRQGASVRGFQVRSNNVFSPGAFSDTLFVPLAPGAGPVRH